MLSATKKFGARNVAGAIVVAIAVSFGCGETPPDPIAPDDPNPTPTDPAEFLRAFGDDQTGFVGELLPRPIGVLVSDENGEPITDVTVDFQVTLGGGTVNPSTVVSDDNGVARASWVLGTRSGAGHSLIATMRGSDLDPVLFHAIARAGTAVTLTLLDGNAQVGSPGERLGTPVTVQVTDRYGNGVEHQIIKFSAETGHGAFVPEDVTADQDGMGFSIWTLGNFTGTQSASVWSPGLTGSPVRLSAAAQ